jgi:hypothetical protein
MKMTMRRARLSTIFCALGLAAATIVPSLAAAEVLPTPKPPGSPYRQTRVNATCGGGACFLDFTPVPANKVLQVDLINCIAVLKNTAFGRGFLVSTKANDLQRAYVPAVTEGAVGQATFVSGALNGPIFFNAGEQIRITVFDSANNDPHCYINGYLFAK